MKHASHELDATPFPRAPCSSWNKGKRVHVTETDCVSSQNLAWFFWGGALEQEFSHTEGLWTQTGDLVQTVPPSPGSPVITSHCTPEKSRGLSFRSPEGKTS